MRAFDRAAGSGVGNSLVTEVRKTGPIWDTAPRSRGQAVRRVCEALDSAYETTRLDNPHDPLDDLVFVILSNKTSADVARRVYRSVKQRFSTWEDVLESPPSVLESLLRPAGLGRVKSRQIRGALRRIKKDFGSCDLTRLRDRAPDSIEEYLIGLPGVSDKVAKCVMMWTLGAQVLPVDSHVHRVARRLGWTSRKRADQCHEELEALVPPERRASFHVECILHGRAVCRASSPECENCCIRRYCQYNKE